MRRSMGEQGVMNHAPTRVLMSLVKIHHDACSRLDGQARCGEEIFAPKLALASSRRGVIDHARNAPARNAPARNRMRRSMGEQGVINHAPTRYIAILY